MSRPLALALLSMSCAPGPEGRHRVPGDATFGDGDRFAAAGGAIAPYRATQICPDGATTPGIDVSYWQGSIDWSRVAGDVDFAIIRVSDGLNYPDTRFDENWQGAQDNGLVRGAYQFFRPSLDAVAQADLLLDTMGALEPGDLAPVLDVETSDGRSASTVNAAIQDWMDRVEGELGVRPYIYTSWGLWSSITGDTAQFADYPLWVANWGVACPSVPDAWDGWSFWQHTDAGSVSGISGNVDENWFNGDLAALGDEGVVTAECGDGVCNGDETSDTCPGDCPTCATIPAEGRVVEDDEVCFFAGGSPQYWYTGAAGSGGSLTYTHTTDAATFDNYGVWTIDVDVDGEYVVDVYTAAAYAESQAAAYEVAHADGTDTIVVDQTAIDGWSPLGTFRFEAGGVGSIRLEDNTGEPWNGGETQIVFDAVRVMPLAPPPPTTDPPTTPPTTPPETTGTPDDAAPPPVGPTYAAPTGCGCSASAAAGPAWLVAVAGLALVRRRRQR